MPYPESCPECAGAFRNTGTHFTARRNEIGRHVLLELGCQNTSRRFWWDFTTGSPTDEGRPKPLRRTVAATNGVHHPEVNGHVPVATLEPPAASASAHPDSMSDTQTVSPLEMDRDNGLVEATAPVVDDAVPPELVQEETLITEVVELAGPPPVAAASPKDAFVRQLQLDRLTMRQMRSWLMADEARRAIEVAAGATEATYERLSLILFGVDLAQLLGKQVAAPTSSGMSAEERLELQREKARIRARLRRAAAKSARQPG